MSSSHTKAAINLYAILRNLEELCEVDEASQGLIRGKQQSIRFSIQNGPSATLVFRDGKCKMTEDEGSSSIKLYFRSTDHFNRMIDGAANPIPVKGFTKLGFLTNEFNQLTKRLEYYLKPQPELLGDPDFFRQHTGFLLHTAAYALACIANYDRIGQEIAKRIPDGVVSLSIQESGQQVFLEAKGGRLKAMKSSTVPPRSFMIFDTVQSAGDLLSERADVHELVVRENLLLKGMMPMIQHLSDILSRVPLYI
ncbi:hypothetical protein KIH86_09465 [Paenibacillus sp. HN-1]|uniref:hypothetical protein n=1 Tax=Paenibacillus TaxID=44249 RepID=UPI001CA7E2DE|nr:MULTISPECIES: hypothetical protein [Paenibacillus]MBY9079814.1 hypothetical protein [Paenibacillus sp. CGMCC 1.18879]MBY9084456.1 hypothetical protein [Paenibacillus sinensis]